MKLMLRFRPIARGVLSLLIFCFFGFQVSSQNLVPNGSFEEVVTCPTQVANLTLECQNWYSSIVSDEFPTSTPDWFHTCSESEVLSPPDIAFGTQALFDGEGMAGFVSYSVSNVDPNYRELLAVELTESLAQGNTYLVTLQISSLSFAELGTASDKLGFNFSTHPFYNRTDFPINTSHFYLDTILNLSDEWTEFSVLFEADSSYSYLHIGNFFDDSNTQFLKESENSLNAYYLVDDVQVTNVLNTEGNTPIVWNLYPNPTRGRLSLKLNSNEKVGEIRIFNSVGKLVYGTSISSVNQVELDVSQFPNGIYYIHFINSKSSFYGSFVKI